MKTKAIFMLLTLQFTTTVQQIPSDPIPPEDFIEQTEKLELAESKDTIASNTVFILSGEDYTASTFNTSKKFAKPVKGVAGKNAKLNKLILANKTTEYLKLDLIYNLRKSAIYLTKTDFNFDESKPIQTKIAYSWGSKDHTIRQNPPGGEDICTYAIHGLDCSGLIYQLFKLNNILLPAGQCNADTERKPDFLKKYLTPYFKDKKFDIIDKGAIAKNEIQSGDIIYFKNAKDKVFHIGILFVSNEGTVTLFQSLGRPSRKSSDNACDTNLDSKHGPIPSVIGDDYLKKLNKNYGCVRIIAI